MFLAATVSENSVPKNLLKKKEEGEEEEEEKEKEKEEEKNRQTLYVFQLSLEDIITHVL